MVRTVKLPTVTDFSGSRSAKRSSGTLPPLAMFNVDGDPWTVAPVRLAM